jgi:hypothetical protein
MKYEGAKTLSVFGRLSLGRQQIEALTFVPSGTKIVDSHVTTIFHR